MIFRGDGSAIVARGSFAWPHRETERHAHEIGPLCRRRRRRPRGDRLVRVRPVAHPDPDRRLLDRAALRRDRRRGLRRELRFPHPRRLFRRLLGAGLQQFCAGVGLQTIDIANSSRPIREGEIESCKANGVHGHRRGPHRLRRHRLRLRHRRPGLHRLHARALVQGAGRPGAQGRRAGRRTRPRPGPRSTPACPTPRSSPSCPAPSTAPARSSTRRSSCRAARTPAPSRPSPLSATRTTAHDACVKLRTDGRSIDIDGDYTETLARIQGDANGIGVFGLSFYEANTSALKVATMSGVAPSVETIASGDYPVSRPLYFYLKKAHLAEIAGPEGIRRVLHLGRGRRPGRPARDLRPRLRSRAGRDPGRGRRGTDHGLVHVIVVRASAPGRRRGASPI